MERGSDKHGPALDEALKHEVEGTLRARHGTHAQEWAEPEPSGEDQPDVDEVPHGTRAGGTPPGMTAEDVNLRAEIAAHIGQGVYPATREQLLLVMAEQNAPTRLIELVGKAPEGPVFANVNELAEALGIGVEQRRF